MNLETRAREAAERLHTATPVDAQDGLRRLHRARRRRTTGKFVAALTAVAVGLGVAQIQRDRERALPPVSPSGHWVIVSGSGSGSDWSEPLTSEGVQTYPQFLSADPATRRFLTGPHANGAWAVMTPGRREPLVAVPCSGPCPDGAALGPGPDELTMFGPDSPIVVVGPDGQTRRDLGPTWTPSPPGQGGVMDLAWSPDGRTWAESRYERIGDQASLTVLLRDPDTGETTTLYQYSESAPPWWDAEKSDDGWFAPYALYPQWAPDSDRLAFITMTVSELAYQGQGGDRDAYQLSLVVADTATGEVDHIDVGRCACRSVGAYFAWAPDGKTLTVRRGPSLLSSALVTYDLSGEQVDTFGSAKPGPLVWLQVDSSG